MKHIVYFATTIALWCSAGNMMAQTPITSFPYTDVVNGYYYQTYSFTLTNFSRLIVSAEESVNASVYVENTGGGGYYSYGNGSISEGPVTIVLGAGNYVMSVCNYGDQFTLKVDAEAPPVISLPYNQNLNFQASEEKIMKFILTEATLLSLNTSLSSNPSLSIGIQLVDNDAQYHYFDDIAPAGTYYLILENYSDKPCLLNMELKAIKLSSIASYTEIDYSKPFNKGVLLSGTFSFDDLVKYQQRYYDNEEEKEYVNTNCLRMKGFTLSVTAGKQYSFENLSSNIDVLVLKNGALDEFLYENAIAWRSYYADATQNVRVVIMDYNDISKESGYTIKVVEKDAPATVPLTPVLDAAASIDYASLPFTQSVNLSAETPRALVTLTDEDEFMSWVTPVVAYKMTMPSGNTGIHIHAFPNSGVLIYQKTGGLYELLDADNRFDLPYVDPGEYYLLFVNEPELSQETSFTINIWKTGIEPGGITLKALLDATNSTTAPPCSLTGNTSAGVFIPELESDYWFWSPSKAHAWKITLTGESDEVYVRSNMSLLLFAKDGSNYEYLDSTWEGRFDLYWLPAGDYYIVGAIEGGEGDFWLQMSKSPIDTKVTSITTAASIGVNPGASNVEIKALLSLLTLTAHLSNGFTTEMDNEAYFWEIAAGGASATLNRDYVWGYGYYELDEEAILPVVKISYTGNNLSINSAQKETYTVYTQDYAICAAGIEVGTSYQLFNLSGLMMTSGTSDSDSLRIPVAQKGIYILRIAGEVRKVMVK